MAKLKVSSCVLLARKYSATVYIGAQFPITNIEVPNIICRILNKRVWDGFMPKPLPPVALRKAHPMSDIMDTEVMKVFTMAAAALT